MPSDPEIRLERVLRNFGSTSIPCSISPRAPKATASRSSSSSKTKAFPSTPITSICIRAISTTHNSSGAFQRQLYDALHDYFVEMFIRTPQDRELRQREDRQEDRQRKSL